MENITKFGSIELDLRTSYVLHVNQIRIPSELDSWSIANYNCIKS